MKTLRSLLLGLAVVAAIAADPAAYARAEGGRRGVTLYVSKQGDNSNGRSWQTAFHTLQAALSAIPDAEGGHRVVIRPGTYAEANLWPAYRGAKGAYNELVGDFDGRLGSGATGWVVIDSGAPDVIVRTNPKAPTGNPTFMILAEGDPSQETGLKSVDWWGPWRSDPEFSAIGWDRWVYRHLYVTGSEGGIGWDLTCEKGSMFSAVVEDCVGIGRFAGACVMAHEPRPGEPVVFRRCYFLNLDWWGDAGGVYVRGESPTRPEAPHAVFEDCTIIGPDNALQAGYPGVDDRHTRVHFTRCRLIVLNFSQPHGTPSSGIVCCGCKDGKQLEVEFEDCDLMGFKVFGTRSGEVSYTTRGRCTAYVQYRSPVPSGFERLRFWPVDLVQALQPPPPGGRAASGPTASGRPQLEKLPIAIPDLMEQTPVVFRGAPLLVGDRRDPQAKAADCHLFLQDLRTGKELGRFAERHSFVSAWAEPDALHVFAAEYTDDDWSRDIFRFRSADLKTWDRELAVARDPGEHLFNSSVCRDGEGYLMAYESNVPVQFCFKFARSADLAHWRKVEGLVFTGQGREYSACPVLRYVAPHYYVIYLHEGRVRDKAGWVPWIARSRDLERWDLSPFNPILTPTEGEGLNNSDVDLFEWEGSTYLTYATGDQSTWGSLRLARYSGPMAVFLSAWFPDGTPCVTVRADGAARP
ncbi:MAG TPA: hypothetical protein PKM73_17120 [Verrucomicrobiota bacterium]|nr:hypothetical protein [Verrucomicrobiota bacterium]HNU52946.1 hypothetical protein [Verrucomicrobiota bacterium]